MPVTRLQLVGLAWAFLAIVIWSGSLVMLRLGVTTSLNAYDLTMIRFGVAAVILVPVVVRLGARSQMPRWWWLAAMVIAFGAPYIVLVSLAMKTAPASIAGALNPGVMAIAAILLGHWLFGDKLGATRVIGLGVTISGVMLSAALNGPISQGHLILTGTGIMWAVYVLIMRHTALPALHATAIIAIGSAVLFAPYYILILPKEILVAPAKDIAIQAIFQGVLVSVIAIYAFNRSAECLGPVIGATLPAFIPIITISLGVIILEETVSTGELAAAGVLTFGLVLILAGTPALRWLAIWTPQGPKR